MTKRERRCKAVPLPPFSYGNGVLSREPLYILPLAPQPHLYPLAEDLGGDEPAVGVLGEYLRRGEPVQHRLQRRAGVAEADMLQPPAVHKLDALAELALLEPLGIRHAEMLVQHLHRPDAVDAVDRREQVIGVVEVRLVLQKRRQIEVILGEHDAHRLHPALHQLGFFHALIPDLNDLLIADGLPQLPQVAQHALAVVGGM